MYVQAHTGSFRWLRASRASPAGRGAPAPARPVLNQTVGGQDQRLAESSLKGIAGSELFTGLPVQIHVPVGHPAAMILAVATNLLA